MAIATAVVKELDNSDIAVRIAEHRRGRAVKNQILILLERLRDTVRLCLLLVALCCLHHQFRPGIQRNFDQCRSAVGIFAQQVNEKGAEGIAQLWVLRVKRKRCGLCTCQKRKQRQRQQKQHSSAV